MLKSEAGQEHINLILEVEEGKNGRFRELELLFSGVSPYKSTNPIISYLLLPANDPARRV